MIYMDNGAAEKPSAIAIRAAESILEDFWANPNSAHAAGRAALDKLENARECIAIDLNCEPDEVHFCSCACEAATWAVKCMSVVCGKIVSYATEHSCVLEAVEKIQPYINEKKPKLGFVSMLANNETGEINFLSKLGDNRNLRFVDATAAVGHIPVDFKALGCDYLCADAMKFGGIPGAAFLIIKRGAPIVPLIYGNEERGGTPTTALIVAMAAALADKVNNMHGNAVKTCHLRDDMIRELLQIPGAHLNGPWTPGNITSRLPGNINISFEGIDGTSLGLLLTNYGIMTSAGSACTSGNNEPSHVLLSMGVPPELAKGTIRLTINEDNTTEECKKVTQVIAECVRTLRSF